MPWQKQETITPEVSNQNLTAVLRLIDDPDPPDPGDVGRVIQFELRIANDAGVALDVGTVYDDNVLTSQEQTTIRQILVKLRNGALQAAGYVDAP